MRVQDILNDNPIAGVPKVSRHDEVPLKTFARDEVSKMPFTGYKTKGNWYYKIKEGKHPVNVSAKHLNSLFVTLLSGFEYNPNQRSKIVNAITKKLKERLFESSRDAMLTRRSQRKKPCLKKLNTSLLPIR
jgi:hypothetical protein